MIKAADTALVIAAHGDRGSAERNATVSRHALTLGGLGAFKAVYFGVLNGLPSLANALQAARSAGSQAILVYPFFMSDGYFVRKVLPERIAEAGCSTPVRILPPLGIDPALPDILLRRSLATAHEAGFPPLRTRLLLVGHGSKIARASAEATERVAGALARTGAFGRVATAFLEEPPFVSDAIAAETVKTVVAGFFSGEGMHGHDDVPAAIAAAPETPCAYTRPIGGDPGICALIEAAALRAVHEEKSPLAH